MFMILHRLLKVLQRLVDTGELFLSLNIILDVIKTADYIVDLGPEGGEKAVKSSLKEHPKMYVRLRNRIRFNISLRL